MKRSEGYESNVAGFAKCGPKDSFSDVTEDPAALFAFSVKDMSGA